MLRVSKIEKRNIYRMKDPKILSNLKGILMQRVLSIDTLQIFEVLTVKARLPTSVCMHAETLT
jgi:hypothetical protein